ESRIAQTISKGIQRFIVDIQVIASEFFEPLSFRQWSPCVFMRVVGRDLTDSFGESHRDFSLSFHATEYDVGYGFSGLGTAKPYIQDSLDMFIFPSQGQWSSCKQYQDDRFSRREKSLKQISLSGRDIKVCPARTLARHFGGFAQGCDNHVSLL